MQLYLQREAALQKMSAAEIEVFEIMMQITTEWGCIGLSSEDMISIGLPAGTDAFDKMQDMQAREGTYVARHV
jgi:hypothetical protein